MSDISSNMIQIDRHFEQSQLFSQKFSAFLYPFDLLCRPGPV